MEKFKLPGSSYVEIIKMIRAYGSGKVGMPCSLDDISKMSAVDKTQISRNNGFLIEVGLLQEGKNKAPTEICSNLAKAYSLNLSEKIAEIWKKIILENNFLNSMINVITLKSSMQKSDYIGHLIYSSGCTNTNNSKAGATALIEIFKTSNILIEDNGVIYPGNFTQNETLEKKEIENVNEKNDLHLDQIQDIKHRDNSNNLSDYFIQEFMCANGKKAKLCIPNDATEDDIITIYEFFKVIIKRKYKISIDDLN